MQIDPRMMLPPGGDQQMAGAREGLTSALDAEAEGKQSKDEANYRPAEANEESCASCVNADFPMGSTTGTCQVVAGKIAVDGVSDLFEPSESPPERKAPPAEAEGPELGA